MYAISGYLNNFHDDFIDQSKPLVVGSCGTYRLYKKYKMATYRPKGRKDYQLIYIASGKGHFFFDGETEEIEMGKSIKYVEEQSDEYVQLIDKLSDIGIVKDIMYSGLNRHPVTTGDTFFVQNKEVAMETILTPKEDQFSKRCDGTPQHRVCYCNAVFKRSNPQRVSL